jgi:exosortase
MVPLPYSLEQALREPLRRIGTHAGTYVLQTLGFAAISEGNVIVIEDTRVGVEEACSGLRMLMIFFALSTAVALLSKRVLWERVLIVLSAVPIALVANITRISATAILHRTAGPEIANMVFHDLAGWLMMPVALLLLWLELWILGTLFLPEPKWPMPMTRGR